MATLPAGAQLRALDVLGESDRATVVRWLAMLGMEPEDLDAVPALRQMVDMVASMALVGRMTGHPREAAYREAAAILGCGDQLRTWYRWQNNVARQLVRPNGRGE